MPRDDKFSMRLPAQLKAELQRRADAQERSLANYVTLALQEHVDRTPAPSAPSEAYLRAVKTSKSRKS
jgi:predicted transcriptional regulator